MAKLFDLCLLYTETKNVPNLSFWSDAQQVVLDMHIMQLCHLVNHVRSIVYNPSITEGDLEVSIN